ncbi:hypothetical protein JCM31598_33580 [Desulfonatronum parangueonense]
MIRRLRTAWRPGNNVSYFFGRQATAAGDQAEAGDARCKGRLPSPDQFILGKQRKRGQICRIMDGLGAECAIFTTTSGLGAGSGADMDLSRKRGLFQRMSRLEESPIQTCPPVARFSQFMQFRSGKPSP